MFLTCFNRSVVVLFRSLAAILNRLWSRLGFRLGFLVLSFGYGFGSAGCGVGQTKKDAGCSARAAPLLVVSSLDVCGGYHVFFCVFWVWLVMAVVFLLLGACHIASSLPHYVAFVCGYFPAFLYVPLWSSQPSCLLLREQSRHLRLLKTV